MFGKKKLAAILAEFIGTFVLASVVFSLVNRTSFPFFAAVAAGAVLGLMTLIVGNISGAHLNPAITLGLWSLRKLQTTQAVVFVAAQLLGGLVAWRLSEWLINESLPRIAGYGVDWRVLVAEALGTLVFAFGVAAAVYKAYEGLTLATVVGTSLTVGIIVASIAANGLVNPAVAVGLNSVSWAYAVGPVVGSVIGMNLFALVFAPAPETTRRRSTKKK